MRSARGSIVSVMFAVAALGGCSWTAGASSDASCAQPHTTASQNQARAGESITVSAERMWDGCNDQGRDEALPPLTHLPVIWSQSGTEVELTQVDADPDSGLAQATVRVPAAAIPGPAELRIGTYTTAATITVSAG